MSETITTKDGATLHFEQKGDGPPLLLLHGFGGTSQDFRHVFDLEVLARSFRVISPDARGHGRSTNPSGEFTFRLAALDVGELMDRLGIERVRAVGVSLGAKTLLHLSTERPSLVERMVLVSAAPRFPEATRAAMRAVASSERTPDEWASMRLLHVHGDEQIAALFRLPYRFADDATDMSFTVERLAAVRARTLLVAGESDELYPVELAMELQRGIPGCESWIVPGEGHSPIFGPAREDFVRRTLAFLTG